ncbi:MAG: hypothetical protein IJV80_05560 [Clostridia bacterium]|nr:hypothetical protein [Clostridia bacterium]
MKFTAYEIALSALSCALATILLTLGTYIPVLLFTGYLFGSIALMLPLAKGTYKGFVLAYLATVVLTLIFNGFNFFDVLPFAVFFGLHPLVNELQLKTKINVWLACFVKAVWFDGTMYLVWRFIFESTTAIPFVDKYFIPILIVVGTAFFVFYDFTLYRCRGVVNKTVERFIKK